MGKSSDRKHGSVPVVEMDARTLLRTINSGALSQYKVFSERVRRMGQEQGTEFELVSLNANALIYEDLETGVLYRADVKKLKGGRIRVDNISELAVVESQKKDIFNKACVELVEAISEDDQKSADIAFGKISKQHFRNRVIPSSGMVTTRDGLARHVYVTESIVPSEIKPFIVKAICEALSDNIRVSKGRIVEAVFGDDEEPLKIPVTELTRRRVVARHMKEAAETAYKSDAFQKLTRAISANVSKSRIQEAVKIAATFLKEEQEFSLLTLDETKGLVADSLAATGCFNDQLASDVGTLFFRTGCKINKDDIVESWQKTARRSEHAALVENARILAESKNFEADYQEFLGMVFNEDLSTRSVRGEAYLNSLKSIRKVLEGQEENEGLLSAIDDYILKLDAGEEVDDATLYEVEDLLASISQELIQDVQSLADFDDIPEPAAEPAEEFGQKDLSAEAGGGGASPAVSLPMGGEEEGVEPEAGAGEEEIEIGGEEEPEEEPELMAADVDRGDALTEDEEVKTSVIGGKKIKEHPGKLTSALGEPAFKASASKLESYVDDAPDAAEKEKRVARVNLMKAHKKGHEAQADEEITKSILDMGKEELNEELKTWRSNFDIFLAEDGQDRVTAHLKNYITQATTLKENDLVAAFRSVLAKALIDESEEVDPYTFLDDADLEIDPNYGTIEEDERMDQPGKGVQPKNLTDIDTGSGKKEKMDQSGKGVQKKSTGSVMEGEGDEDPTGVGMGDRGGKSIAAPTPTKSDATSGSEGGSGSKEGMDDRGGKGVAPKSATSSDAKSGSEGGSGKAQKMDRVGGDAGVVDPGMKDTDGTSGKDAPKAGHDSDKGSVHEDATCPECGATKCPESCKTGKKKKEMDEEQYKNPTKRRPRGFERSSIASEDIDDAIAQVVTEMGVQDDVIDQIADATEDGSIEEGGLPPSLEKHKFKKKGEKEEGGEEEGEKDEGGDTIKCSKCGTATVNEAGAMCGECEGGMAEGKNKKCKECKCDPCECPEGVTEDNDVTQPDSAKYDSAEAARKDGSGKQRRPKPKVGKEFDGTGDVTTAG
jgi:hypothetical protein